MGTSCACIVVRVPKKGDLRAVIQEIDASYTRRGARRGPDVYRADLQPLSLSEAKRRTGGPLGVAISPANEGWVTIIDSERYDVDAALARELAEALKTTAFWVSTSDASNSYRIHRFGKPEDWSAAPADFQSTYYDQLDETGRNGWTVLTFDDVPPGEYDREPPEYPRCELVCAACEEAFSWSPGADQSRRTPPVALDLLDDSLVAESPNRLGEDTPLLQLGPGVEPKCKVLIAIPCPRCQRVDGAWVDATWERGLIQACRALPSKPKGPKGLKGYGFQFGPFPQEVSTSAAGATRVGYLSTGGRPIDGLLEVGSQASQNVIVDQSFAAVLAAFIRDPAAKSLLVLKGQKPPGRNPVPEDLDDPVCLQSPIVEAKFDRPATFEAWMRGLLLRTGDPVSAEAQLREATLEDWGQLFTHYEGISPSIAQNTKAELERAAAALARADAKGRTTKELFELAGDDNREAAQLLELAAIRERNFMLWRYARAVADGKSAVSKLYKGRVQLA